VVERRLASALCKARAASRDVEDTALRHSAFRFPFFFFRTSRLEALIVSVPASTAGILWRRSVRRAKKFLPRDDDSGADRIARSGKRVQHHERFTMKDRTDFTVLTAMLKAGLKHKRKLKPVAYAKRLATELTAQRRRYCNAFGFWRVCQSKSCKRLRACSGDPTACLARGISGVPREQQAEARRHSGGDAAQHRRAGTRGASVHADGLL
jgi:hypothetical protein